MHETVISYRRTDSDGHAGRIFDRLRHWFDDGVVFYDRDTIEGGDHFPRDIETAVRGARAVLVLIGRDWVESLNKRATEGSVDFVRREVELALTLGDEDNERAHVLVLL